MCRLLSVFLVTLGIVGQSCFLAVAGEAASTQRSASTVASRVLAVVDVVLENHIDPPARQQLVLAAAKTFYRVTEQPAPAKLSRQISELATDEQFSKYLHDLLAPSTAKLPDVESLLVQSILLALPEGTARLVSTTNLQVEGQLAANRYVGTGTCLTHG